MPGHTEAMKAVVSCEKLRQGAHTRYDPQIAEWGNPAVGDNRHFFIEERTLGTETSKYREEGEINRDVLSSGERNGRSPNQTPLGVWGCRTCGRCIGTTTEVDWNVAP